MANLNDLGLGDEVVGDASADFDTMPGIRWGRGQTPRSPAPTSSACR